MASDRSFVDFVCDQISGAGPISCRKMFGEFAISCRGKVVALVCDNRLFVKPTQAGQTWAGSLPLAPPYPGAKPHFLIGQALDDRAWVSELIRLTELELPAPTPKAARSSKAQRHRNH